jgi:hypothetical protein
MRCSDLRPYRHTAQVRADSDEEPFVLVLDHGRIVPLALRKFGVYQMHHAGADTIPGETFYPEPRTVRA